MLEAPPGWSYFIKHPTSCVLHFMIDLNDFDIISNKDKENAKLPQINKRYFSSLPRLSWCEQTLCQLSHCSEDFVYETVCAARCCIVIERKRPRLSSSSCCRCCWHFRNALSGALLAHLFMHPHSLLFPLSFHIVCFMTLFISISITQIVYESRHFCLLL